MNSLILSGHITKELQLKTFTNKNGEEVTRGKSTIAVNNNKDEVIFMPFEIWGTKAEKFSELSTKGTRVNLQGKIKQSIFEKENNEKSFFTYMSVIGFEITDTKEVTERRKTQQEEKGNPFGNTDKTSIYDMDLENDEDLPF